jgi:mRNA interferase RelE/StbE
MSASPQSPATQPLTRVSEDPERAVRQLRAIPPPAVLTILRALAPLGDDPRRPDASLRKLSGYDDRYRLRVGDYRVIYEVLDGQLVILVVGVGHRREIYPAMS